jgi:hypothetical protein
VGYPALSLFHTELWLVLSAAVWTAGYLIWRRTCAPHTTASALTWLAAVALLAMVPAAVNNVIIGDADTTGSVLLGVGVLALGIWIDTESRSCLALAGLLLTAAASVKDEDLLGAVCVILAAGIVVVARPNHRNLGVRAHLVPLLALTAYFAALVLPWRLWLRAHHLSDSVEPPIPHALNPLYFLDRGTQLKETAAAMVTQTLQGWDWLAAIFIVVCLICLKSGTARRAAAFYLTVFVALISFLLWLYATTPLSLAFLLPTSMDRTVSVFMALTPLATAHLLASLLHQARSDAPLELKDPRVGFQA